MKTGFDILKKIFVILNVDSVNNVIDGRIYRRRKKPNSELQDIVILTLTTAFRPDVQPGTIIINIYCKNLQYGFVDETKLKQITDTVTTVLEAYNQTGSEYFDFDIISENTMQDTDQEAMSYTSLRINCMIQKL